MNFERVAISSVTIAAAIGVAAGVAWAAGAEGAVIADVPVTVICAALAFLVQWAAFVPAYLKQTERFYDLMGSITYVAVVGFALAVSDTKDGRSIILASLIFVWAARLGAFLFRRVLAEGGDSRFDDIKPSASRFLVAWTLQGLWVFLTLSAALAAITATKSPSLNLLDGLGISLWAVGFGIEVVADFQKRRFRERNPERFVHTGLWAWSRHPNYFGEIVLWIGVFVLASSSLSGWQWATVVSPVFVIALLTRISGIPILEKRADERWGDQPSYRRYKESTPVLIPRPPRR